MPGMLTDAQAPALPGQAPSSGPGPQTPPIESAGAATPPLDGASGPGQPPPGQPPQAAMPPQEVQDPQALKDKATQIIYGERFDSLVKMFQTNGKEKFPRSMAIAVNTAINEIEKDGPIPPEAAAQLGMDVFAMLLEDMATEPEKGMPPVVPEVGPEELQEVLPAILVMYGDAHPDVSKEDLQAVMNEVSGAIQGQMGAGGAQPAGPDTGVPAPEAGSPAGATAAPPAPGMLSQAGGAPPGLPPAGGVV